MKPLYVFSIVAVTLTAGTLFSRFAAAGGTQGQAPAPCFGEAGANALWRATEDEAIPVAKIAGTLGFGNGELPALERISEALNTDAGAAVGVTWAEDYHRKTITMRAYYLPAEQALLCQTHPNCTVAYQPVTRAGIETALREGRIAPFANANLYSLPHAETR